MPRSTRIHLPSLLLFIIFGLTLALLVTVALASLGSGLLTAIAGRLTNENILPLFNLGWMAGLLSLLLLPAILLALLRLLEREPPAWRLANPLRLSSLLLLIWPLLIWLGSQLAKSDSAVLWLIFPPLQLAVILIPLWWFIEIGRRKLANVSQSQGWSAQRDWSILGISLVVTPTLVVVLEIVALVGLIVLAGLWLGSQPALAQQFERTANRLLMTQLDPEVALRVLRPYLQSPLLIYGLLAVASGLAPLMEEALKPLALWGLPHKLTPAQGFIGGTLCGAAFALVESLGQLATLSSDSWTVLVLGRAGTGLLHIVTSGLVGWGLANAWGLRAYWKLAMAFLVAVLLHAIWNVFGMLMGLTSFLQLSDKPAALPPLFEWIGKAAPVSLGVLTLFLLAILVVVNLRLRGESQPAELAGPSALADLPDTAPPDRTQ